MSIFLIFALIKSIIAFSDTQTQLYDWVPLCCLDKELYNGSECVPFQGLAFQNLPLTYEKPANLQSVVLTYHPLVNCSRYVEENINGDLTVISGIRIFENGSVALQYKPNNTNPFVLSQFCMMQNTNLQYLFRICTEDQTEVDSETEEQPQVHVKNNFINCFDNICISKCCPPGYFVSFKSKMLGCYPLEHEFSNFIPNFKSPNGTEISVRRNVNFIIQFPLCKLYEYKNIILLTNGSVYLPTTGELIHRDQYCLDTFDFGGRKLLRGSICSETLELTFAEKLSRIIHPIGLLVSCIFLAVTFICHVIIPKLRDMQGLCFMSYVSALFFAFLLLCLNILIPKNFSKYGCVGLAILNHFSLMSSFFWLNVMCFDIWKVIRGTVSAVHLRDIHSNTRRTFIFYCFYGWGAPLLVSLVALTVHLLPDESVSDYVIRPQFRKAKCWFPNDLKVLFAYYNGIIAVLFLVNIVFIFHTSILLYKAGVTFVCCRPIKRSNSDDDHIIRNNRLLLNMFWHRFCLFALMAFSWTTEILSFIPPPEMWILTDIINSRILTDIINTLQGLLVFILFIRSTNKRMMLAEAWRKVVFNARTRIGHHKKRETEARVHFLKQGETDAKTNIVALAKDENE